jgi:DNA invertase Pin-like site-specific DNA recombinase
MEKIQLPSTLKKNCDAIAAVYVRVSSTKQRDQGHSLDNQLKLASKYAEENELTIPEDLIFKEDASASKFSDQDIDLDDDSSISLLNRRPKLQKLLFDAQQKKYSHIIIYSRDRLTRSVEESYFLNSIFKKYNIQVHYTKPGEDLLDESNYLNIFMSTILNSLSEFESSVLATRIKDCNKNCVLNGYWPGGKIPFGFKSIQIDSVSKYKKNSKLSLEQYESSIVGKIFSYYLNGYGYRRIAKILNSSDPKYNWTKNKIEGIIKNETYTGKIVWDRRGNSKHPGRHESVVLSPFDENSKIIDNVTFTKSKSFRTERTSNSDPYLHFTPYILKGKLYCTKCKSPMKPVNPGNTKTPVYVCSTCKTNNRIPYYLVEDTFFNEIKKTFQLCETDKKTISEMYYSSLGSIIEDYESLIENLKIHANNLDVKIKKLKDALNKESDSTMKSILSSQITLSLAAKKYYDEKIDEYTEVISKRLYESDDFTTLLHDSINKLFSQVNDSQDFLLYKRNFILTFIEKVFVSYLKTNNSLVIDKILFKQLSDIY